MYTEALDFVLGTNNFVEHSQILSFTLQAPYALQVDHGNGGKSVPLEQSEYTSSYVQVCKKDPPTMMVASKVEDYQLLGDVLDQGLKELGYSREDLNLEPFASDKQHVLDLYCSKEKNCCYKLSWPPFGLVYGNPRFSELGEVSTSVTLQRSRMVLCSPDLGAHGGNEYWRTLLHKLTLSSVQLPDDAMYVPLGRMTPIGKPGWGSMLSVVDGGLTPVPWEDLDPAMVQQIRRESDGYTLSVLKDRLRPQDAVGTTPGGMNTSFLTPLPPTPPAIYLLLRLSQSVGYPRCPTPYTLMTKPSMTPSSCRQAWGKLRTRSTLPHRNSYSPCAERSIWTRSWTCDPG